MDSHEAFCEMKLTVRNLEWDIGTSESLALFDKPIERDDEIGLLKSGLRDAQFRATGCLGWIWRKWLAAASPDEITARVEPFINRSLELRDRCQSYEWLPQHDLLLLVCAILASTPPQLRCVVDKVANSSGDKGEKPMDTGELYAAAWCGMVKHWILRDAERASEEFNLIWGARRDRFIRAAQKPLAAPWLHQDWSAFVRAQRKDFARWWERARKWGAICSENKGEVVVTTTELIIDSGWCWAHCALAVLGYGEGADVVTDPLWLPPHALKCVQRLKK